MEDSILLLEHINLNTDNPDISLNFFINGLGCVQDPRKGEVFNDQVYINSNIWVNCGINQFHLPITTRGSGGAKINLFSGNIGLSYENIDILVDRFELIKEKLVDTFFNWHYNDDKSILHITGPFGNKFVAHSNKNNDNKMYIRDTRGFHPGCANSLCLGIPYIEVPCPTGSCQAIGNFYNKYLGATVTNNERITIIKVGPYQEIRFVESDLVQDISNEDYSLSIHGMHIAIYIKDHLVAMKKLIEDNLLWGNPRFTELDSKLSLLQFRFKDIIDPDNKDNIILELEHEVRRIDHESSPFNHSKPYHIPNRKPVPLLISSITKEYEKDFENIRNEKLKLKVGYIPNPYE